MNLKWKVTFKVEEDGELETRTVETEAATERKAISNAWFKAGAKKSFWLVKVVQA